MNVNLRLNKDEEVMMSALLIKMPKFRKKKELVLAAALRTYYQNQERTGFKDRAIDTPPPVEEENDITDGALQGNAEATHRSERRRTYTPSRQQKTE